MARNDDEEPKQNDFIHPNYAKAMSEHGVSWNTLATIRKSRCPQCGFEFSLTYARTIACRGCPMATKNCPKVRCAKCDHEFYIQEMSHASAAANLPKGQAKHQSRVERNYNDQIGRTRHR